jgi:MEMO1 family protein
MYVRKPAVAGAFYPDDPADLSSSILSCYTHPLGPGRLPPEPEGKGSLVAFVSPHAAYQYSGPVASHGFLHASSLRDPEILVVMGPDHNAYGLGVSIFKEGEWETPLGSIKVDSAAAEELSHLTGITSFDPEAQRYEHSIEVQLPFLQSLFGNGVPLLPISLMSQDIDTAKALGKGVAEIVKGRRAVVVASSDLDHYESARQTSEKDGALIDRITSLDVEGFYRVLDQMDVRACGFGPIASLMEASSRLGLSKGELMKHADSGDITGDKDRVVGYAALRFV